MASHPSQRRSLTSRRQYYDPQFTVAYSTTLSFRVDPPSMLYPALNFLPGAEHHINNALANRMVRSKVMIPIQHPRYSSTSASFLFPHQNELTKPRSRLLAPLLLPRTMVRIEVKHALPHAQDLGRDNRDVAGLPSSSSRGFCGPVSATEACEKGKGGRWIMMEALGRATRWPFSPVDRLAWIRGRKKRNVPPARRREAMEEACPMQIV